MRKTVSTTFAAFAAAALAVAGTAGTASAAPALSGAPCQYAYCLVERGNPPWDESHCVSAGITGYPGTFGKHPGYVCGQESDGSYAIYAEYGAPLP